MYKSKVKIGNLALYFDQNFVQQLLKKHDIDINIEQ